MTNDSIRSLELIDFENHPELCINIIGLGAVGSRVFEQLICLGARNIKCFDFDEVEGHNLHNQLWVQADIGAPKVEAASEWLKEKYAIDADEFDIEFHDVRVTKEMAQEMTGIVMLCVDSFDARRDIMSGSVKSGNVSLVIEGRCAPSFHNVRCVNPEDGDQVEAFYESLGSDDDPNLHVSVCGLPISFAPVMIACGTMMVMQCINYVANDYIASYNRMTNFISSPVLELGGGDL